MSRNIKKVRKAIEQRKKIRKTPVRSINEESFLVSDAEEKHGFPPEVTGYVFKKREGKEVFTGFVIKGIIAGVLFFSVALLMDSDKALFAKPQDTINNLLQNEFPFAKVNHWYQDILGSPLAFSPQSSTIDNVEIQGVMPVNGNISESFQVNGKGVKITPGKEADVFAHQEGVVIFAGKYSETDKTITVQHADGTNSSYGHLNDVEVHMYQYVTANQRIGTFIPESGKEAMYFSLEKNNDYLDPLQVIEVDDVP